MGTLNFANQGYTGPSTFADAGNAKTINILAQPSFINVTVTGGVLLGSESSLPGVDKTVYATASDFDDVHPGAGLLDTITITFSGTAPGNFLGIDNFSVQRFNGLPNSATYLISDDKGDSTTVLLGSNTSNNDAQTVQFPFTHLATSVTIEAIGPD